MHLNSLSSHSKSSSSLEMMRGFFSCVDDFSARWRLRWCGFLPLQDVIGTCTVPSIDVDDGHGICRKQASLALCRWSADIFQQSAVVRCLTNCGVSMNSPRPQIARSASTYWLVTSSRSIPISSGTCCGFHCVYCFRTWLMDSVIVRPSRTSCNDVGPQQWQHVALEVL